MSLLSLEPNPFPRGWACRISDVPDIVREEPPVGSNRYAAAKSLLPLVNPSPQTHVGVLEGPVIDTIYVRWPWAEPLH